MAATFFSHEHYSLRLPPLLVIELYRQRDHLSVLHSPDGLSGRATRLQQGTKDFVSLMGVRVQPLGLNQQHPYGMPALEGAA